MRGCFLKLDTRLKLVKMRPQLEHSQVISSVSVWSPDFNFCDFDIQVLGEFLVFPPIFTDLFCEKLFLRRSLAFSHAQNTSKHPQNALCTPCTPDRRTNSEKMRFLKKNIFGGEKGQNPQQSKDVKTRIQTSR